MTENERYAFVLTLAGILGLLMMVFVILLGYSEEAKADSLVCNHNGQQLIYTEVEEPADGTRAASVHVYHTTYSVGVKSVFISNTNSSVSFHNGKEYRYGSIIPCTMIKEDVGKTLFLKEYLQQFEQGLGE